MHEYSRIDRLKVSNKNHETSMLNFGIVPMMKRFRSVLTAAIAILALVTVDSPLARGRPVRDRHGAQVIVPGSRLGLYQLGSDGAATLKQLGKPVAIESAKSQTRRVWDWGDHELFFVHTVSNRSLGVEPADGVTIDLLRFSCPIETGIRTANGISTGSTLEEVRKNFPNAQPAVGAPTVYDDVNQGIAFEFAKEPKAESPCIAITIHSPGQSGVVTQEKVEKLLKKGGAH
jgi:hypothetical protein